MTTPEEAERLQQVADLFFDQVPLEHKGDVELMYQSFKARLMLELGIEGESRAVRASRRKEKSEGA